MPRKKFQWSNELRERLYEVYQARWTSYAVLGKRKDSLEQFIAGYMKEKVVDLWATGWMRYEELQREIDRHKNASKKLKEKAKRLSTSSAQTGVMQAATTAGGATATTANINYLKQLEELTATDQSRSRANSDTDSATSASSNSIKRKLDFVSGVRKGEAGGGGGAKPPKIKFQKQLAATLAQMSQISTAAMGVESLPPAVVNNYLKQYEDLTVTTQQSLSRGNSDTDSVASASSSSLKRKLEATTVAVTVGAATQTQLSVKPAKKKCTKQHQQQQQPSSQLDPLLTQPSTSAQAAALNAAVAAAAASMLELASPTKQAAAAVVDHNLFNLITAATLANSPTASVVSAPIISHPSLMASSVHSTTTNSRPTVPHVINLDDYKSPSDILQTSQQLAATTATTTKWQPSSVCSPVTPSVLRCESSSESDGVEIVGVFPAAAKAQPRKGNGNAKPRSKPSQQKSKATSVIVPVNGVNGATALGYNLENMYIYNNNNAASNKLDGGGVIRTAVGGTGVGSTTSLPYDVTKSPQIMAKLTELSALEKRINWSPLMSPNCDLKAAAGVAQATTPPSHTSSVGTGAGVGQATNQ